MHLYIPKRYTLSALLILASVITATCQISSGFLGKHFMLHYDFAASPTFTNPVKNSAPGTYSSGSKLLNGFNAYHNFEFEWMINKRYSAGLLFNTTKANSSMEQQYTYIGETEQSIYTENSSQDKMTYYNSFFTHISAYSIGLSTVWYMKTINPIGGYLKLDMFRTNYKVEIDEDHVFYEENTKPFVDDKYHTYGIALQLGKQKIFFDRVSFRYGIQLGHVFESINLSSSNSAANIIYRDSNRRLRALFDFNLNAGIGVLLF